MASLIFTDGSSSLKTGLCGWGLTGMLGGKRLRMCGAMVGTNQLAELYAVVVTLHGIYHSSNQVAGGDVLPARIVTDSMYAIGCMTTYRKKWESNGFRSATGQVIQHLDLVKNGQAMMDRLPQVEFMHVRGHTGNEGNEEADKLSRIIRYIAEGTKTSDDLIKAVGPCDEPISIFMGNSLKQSVV